MDKLTKYRSTIERLIQDHADLMNSQPVPGEVVDFIFDETRDHYLLLKYGWPRGNPRHYTKLHVRIHEDKIWIEADLTEDGFASELLQAGVPKEDIVIGFIAPEDRPYLDLAA